MIPRHRLPVTAGLLLAVAVCASAAARAATRAVAVEEALRPWTFQEDFSHGIDGWMSFPLPQDVGYDPSLYTSSAGGSTVLVREVTAHGEKVLRLGLHRTLHFHATPAAEVRVVYDLTVCGSVRSSYLALGTADGKRYSYELSSSPGRHDFRLSGREFQVPAKGAKVEGLVIEATIDQPELGSPNRLTLVRLEVEAERPAAVRLAAPALEYSAVEDVAAARGAVTVGHPLLVGAEAGRPVEVAVYDGQGALVSRRPLTAGSSPWRAFEPGPTTPAGLWTAEVRAPQGRARFRFLVLGRVPPHPRVLVTAERLEQLRSASFSKELLDVVCRRAADLRQQIAYNPAAGENIAQLSPVSVFPGLVAYFSLMENYSQAIALNALDYRLSGDRKALEAARRALLTVAAWPTWTPPWFSAHGLHTYYEVGVFTQRVALGYDLIAEQLTTQEKSQVTDAFWKNSIEPTLAEYFFSDRLPVAASNHMANSVGGALAACAALYGDLPPWTDRLGTGLAELLSAYERLLEGLFPGDGSEAEPAGYEDFAMEGMSWGASALQALGIRPRGLERMLGSFWWLRYAEVKPGRFLDTGDFGGELSALSGYAWAAENARDPALRAFYDTAANRSLLGVFHLEHTGRALEEAPGLLDLVCCTRAVPTPPESPLSRIFPLRGSAVLRSGWGPDDTVVSIRVGPWFNHEHHDQGTFQVAAGGEELVGEAGYTDYYKDPQYADYFTQASAHNTVIIDGDPFSQSSYSGRYWLPFRHHAQFVSHVFAPKMDYLAANLAPAYGDSAALNRFTREYLFVKPDVLVIHDRLEAARPHRFTWFLHVPPGAHAELHGAQAIIRQPAALASLTAGGDGNPWVIQPAPVPEVALDNLDRHTVWPRQVFRLNSQKTRSAEFLVGMHLQSVSQPVSSLSTLDTRAGEGLRLKTENGQVEAVFRAATSGPLALGEYTTDGDALALRIANDHHEVLAAQARLLRRGREVVLSSQDPADVVLRDTNSLTAVHVTCPLDTALKVALRRRPLAVILDGAGITPAAAGGWLSFTRLGKGEHLVEIRY